MRELFVIISIIICLRNIVKSSEFIEKVNKIILAKQDCSTSDILYVLFNTTLILECPHKPIEWISRFKSQSSYFTNIIDNNKNLTLTLDKVDNRIDGCVCCRSIKDYSIKCTHIQTMGPPFLSNPPPQSVNTYCDKETEISCPYAGYPALNFTWFYWKGFGPYESLPSVFKSQINYPVLTVDKYYPEIKGNYVCVAENKYGITSKDTEYYYIVRAPINCNEYTQYRSVFLSPEYSASNGGNVTLTCTLRFACLELESCAQQFIHWRDSLFPTNRTLKGEGYNCSTCSVWQTRTIINLESTDFDKNYTCEILRSPLHAYAISFNTTLKTASENIQTFNPIPALLPTTVILITLILSTGITLLVGIYNRQKITMLLYYRLAKEPPYKKGLKYDVFVSFSSLDRDFVEENIYNKVKKAGYKVIWYPDDFLGGDIILQKAKDSIWKSRKTILCLSKNFLQSDYCAAEKAFCFEKAMGTFKNFLIIIKLDECEIPSDLKKLKIVEMKYDTNKRIYNQRDYMKAFSNLKYLLKAPIDSMPTTRVQ